MLCLLACAVPVQSRGCTASLSFWLLRPLFFLQKCVFCRPLICFSCVLWGRGSWANTVCRWSV